MKLLKLILVILLLPVFFGECKKYPEDEKLYWFRSPKYRLLYRDRIGSWTVESFFVNGEDSTGMYCNVPPVSGCPVYTFGHKEMGSSSAYYIGDEDGKWSFSDHKNNIVIWRSNGKPPLFISPKTTSQEWEILQLTKKKFWLKTHYDNKEYFLKLENPN